MLAAAHPRWCCAAAAGWGGAEGPGGASTGRSVQQLLLPLLCCCGAEHGRASVRNSAQQLGSCLVVQVSVGQQIELGSTAAAAVAARCGMCRLMLC